MKMFSIFGVDFFGFCGLRQVGLIQGLRPGEESSDTNGGWIMFVIGAALGVGLIVAAGAAVYASYEAGVNQACK